MRILERSLEGTLDFSSLIMQQLRVVRSRYLQAGNRQATAAACIIHKEMWEPAALVPVKCTPRIFHSRFIERAE